MDITLLTRNYVYQKILFLILLCLTKHRLITNLFYLKKAYKLYFT